MGDLQKIAAIPAASSVTVTAADNNALNGPSTVGRDSFWPTGALIGLASISASGSGRQSFNTFYIISGLSRAESPDADRKTALANALDRLAALQEPLVSIRVAGDVHTREYALTEKGRSVAAAIEAATPRGEASWMLGYGDASLKTFQALATIVS